MPHSCATHIRCDFRGSLHHFRRELLSLLGGEVGGRFSESEKAELWDRFEAGGSLRSIGGVIGLWNVESRHSSFEAHMYLIDDVWALRDGRVGWSSTAGCLQI